MKYLVTGGLGFLGSALSNEILKRGEDLYILDNSSSQEARDRFLALKKEGEVTLFTADIRSRDDVEYVVKKVMPDIVFHTAQNNSLSLSIERPRLDFDINVTRTLNLLEAIRQNVPDVTLITSSNNYIYGPLDNLHHEETNTRYFNTDYPNGISEKQLLNPVYPYGCSQAAAEQYIFEYVRSYNLSAVVLRHTSPFGSGGNSIFYQLVKDAVAIMEGRRFFPIAILGNGKQVSDMLFITDLVKAYFKASSNIKRTSGEAFNIGGGKNNALSILELITILEKELSITIDSKKLPWKDGLQRSFIADHQKATELFHYTPSTDAISALKFVINQIRRDI